MIVYHGTIQEYVDSIRKHGLTPNHKDKAFKVNSIPLPCKDCVYVASEQWYAEKFAQFRAEYVQANPCDSWEVDAGWLRATMVKRCDATPALTKGDFTPVVITFDLPENFMLASDKDSLRDDLNHVIKGTIPPEYIRSIETFS